MSFTTPCKKKTSTSILTHFQKCSPFFRSAYHFDLCHDCRHFWQNHGVEETEATERTREYRTNHSHHAPLLPEQVIAHKGGRSTYSSVVPEPLRIERKKNANSTTRWPRMAHEQAEINPEILPHLRAQAYVRPGTAGSERTSFGTIVVGMRSDDLLSTTQDCELGNFDRPLPLRVRKENTEKQNKNLPTSLPHHSCTTQPKPRLDLDKPLPRPPRRDSPMPGRPFDSQNPERDLPANKYYPRFI